MIKLEDINKSLIFEPIKHTYHMDGKELTSVTTLLSQYKSPFDPTGIIAYKCAQREGITKTEIQQRWKDESNRACDYGHRVHEKIEDYLKTGKIQEDEDADIVRDFAKIKFNGEIYSELQLVSNDFGLAGTCDIAVLNKNTVSISDLKTNKRFDIKSRYNNKFLYPLDYLDENHLTTYSLQILIYGEMIKEHGFKFKPGKILWVDPELRKIEQFEVLDLKKEVKLLLKHFQKMNSW